MEHATGRDKPTANGLAAGTASITFETFLASWISGSERRQWPLIASAASIQCPGHDCSRDRGAPFVAGNAGRSNVGSGLQFAVAEYDRTSPSAREHPRDARLAEQDHHFRCRDLGDCAETCPTGETGAVLPRETRVDRIPYLLQHSIDETALRLSRCHWLPCWRTTAQPRDLQPARGRSTSMVVHHPNRALTLHGSNSHRTGAEHCT